MAKYIVSLTSLERDFLFSLTKDKKANKIRVQRAFILLACEGLFLKDALNNTEIGKLYGVSCRSVEVLRKKFVEQGFEACLEVGQRGARRISKYDGRVEAHLLSLRCSEPPVGYQKWTLRLLACQMVALSYIDSMSKDSVDKILKKTKLSLGK